MVKLLLLLIVLLSFSISSQNATARSIIPTHEPPHPLSSFQFQPQSIKVAARSCSYTVKIKTSCSSSSRTRDQISIAYGDAHGNEVYVKRIDDPRSGTFERCSIDTFEISGPCAYDICYLYLRRTGSDGWKPESVQISGPNIKSVKFNYDSFLPDGVWYGFNLCRKSSLSAFLFMGATMHLFGVEVWVAERSFPNLNARKGVW